MSQVDLLAEWIRDARSAVAFTGAGISTSSGIPDFRSPGGIWSRSQPVLYDDFLRDPAARIEYWRQKAELHDALIAATPTPAHRALARWEREGLLRGVITQNIDGLHQRAGTKVSVELHGTALEVACLGCAVRFPADDYVRLFRQAGVPADCPECAGLLKHATISFGQMLVEADVLRAQEWTMAADLFLAIGSALVVYPAAGFPQLAAQSGARLVIINREPTPLDGVAHLVIQSEIDTVFEELEVALRREPPA